MALKAAAQMKLEAINYTVGVMASLDVTEDVIIEKTKEKVTELEAEEEVSLRLRKVDGELQYSAFDMRSDFVRTRFNDVKTMLSLSAKITGLPIDIKVIKGSAEFTNADIVSALKDLVANIEAMPVEMLEHGADEWSVKPGGMPESLKESEPEDGLPGGDSLNSGDVPLEDSSEPEADKDDADKDDADAGDEPVENAPAEEGQTLQQLS